MLFIYFNFICNKEKDHLKSQIDLKMNKVKMKHTLRKKRESEKKTNKRKQSVHTMRRERKKKKLINNIFLIKFVRREE